jgi:ferredoxin
MAVIKTSQEQVEVPDGSRVKPAAEKLGIPFGCRQGICGTCKIEVLEGSENLDELNEQEEAMGDRDRTHRLACQCSILKGTIKIKSEHSNESSNVIFR